MRRSLESSCVQFVVCHELMCTFTLDLSGECHRSKRDLGDKCTSREVPGSPRKVADLEGRMNEIIDQARTTL